MFRLGYRVYFDNVKFDIKFDITLYHATDETSQEMKTEKKMKIYITFFSVLVLFFIIRYSCSVISYSTLIDR